MSLSPPAELKSKFILIGQVQAADGKADELQKYLSNIAQEANSSKEPGTLTYRIARGVGSEGDKFTVIEEYLDKAAFDLHLQSQALKDLAASGIIAGGSHVFREEFQ